MELPSSRDDGFITALSRFADDEAALVRVYGRVVAARRLTGSHTSRTNAAARQRRGPERRRQPQAVAALRRAVRDLERQTFEARSNSRARGRVSRRRLLDTGVAMAIGLLLGVTGFVLGTNGASRPDVAAAPPSQTSAIAPSSPAAPMPLRPRAVLEKKTRAVRPAVARSPSKKPRRSDSKPHLAFAGGARSIPWVSAVRRD
jgi:hypothetical protein